MMNIRPFTYLSEENCDEHITLSHLMYSRNINRRNIVNDNENVITLNKTLITTRIKHVTAVLNHLWNRFYKEIVKIKVEIVKIVVQYYVYITKRKTLRLY